MKVKVEDEVIEVFKSVKLYEEFTSAEIKHMVFVKYGRNKESVIPTDYCYNRYNKGISLEKHLRIFEYTSDKKFRYLGENYPYTGKVFHKPKGGREVCIGELENGELKCNANEEPVADKKTFVKPNAHKTKRDASLQLRYLVLKRDNFKCCACGASPAKDPSVELHIDHIVPWSKGGETVEENLQTLCSKCNLGKSDM